MKHLLGVSDHVANAIANRLLADIREKDRAVENQIVNPAIVGTMRNPISQQRSHRRLVKTCQPLVVEDYLITGHRFQSVVVSLTEAKGWVLSPGHRGVGIRLDVIGCEGRGRKLHTGAIRAAVIDWHLLPRMIQRAGLSDYDALLGMIRAWSAAMVTDHPESLEIAEWLHEERKRLLVPVAINGKVCAILTGSETGIGKNPHAVLRAITLLSNDMLTADECLTIKRLSDKPATRTEIIKALPQRNGHLID